MELMAPAGSFESIVAAVRNGADAVYFGAGDFNARRNAKNLSGEELAEAFKFCRLRKVNTYITVNTLINDREFEGAGKLIKQLNALGASAIIVQDLGVLKMAKQVAPDLPVHASTQMTVHDLAGAIACRELGFSRVVLSRELPKREIEYITKNCGIETEVFCHGALCMCYSGQCFMSAAIGGRSGNRGLCAQPCRMAYSFDGGRTSEYLSLKDLSMASHLQELLEAGVSCVKIEGRMKRPEYTAIVTRIYKNALECGKEPSSEDLKTLETVFSRGGFTDGYFESRTDDTMFGMRSAEDARAAKPLYAAAKQSYNGDTEPARARIKMEFTGKLEYMTTLVCEDENGNKAEAECEPPEIAQNRPTTREEIYAALKKTGGTIFAAREIAIEIDDNVRISASTINALRRKCLDVLSAQRRLAPKRAEGEFHAGVRRTNIKDVPKEIFSLQKFSQLSPGLARMRPEYIYLPLSEVRENLALCVALQQDGTKIAPVLPRIIFDSEWEEILRDLQECKSGGINSVVCTNIGHAQAVRELEMEMRADFGLNIMNSQSIKVLREMGFSSFTASFEMNFGQIRDLSKPIDCEIIVYGRLPLMIFENCAIKRGASECACKEHEHFLEDKTGRAFPLMPEFGCRNTLYNSDVIDLADKKRDWEKLGAKHARLLFTTEDAGECVRAVMRYRNEEATRNKAMTRGLYYRGVE